MWVISSWELYLYALDTVPQMKSKTICFFVSHLYFNRVQSACQIAVIGLYRSEMFLEIFCKLVSVVTSLMGFVGFSVFVAGLTVAHFVCIAVYLTAGVRWFKQKLFLIQTPGPVPLEFVLGRFDWTYWSFVKSDLRFHHILQGSSNAR